MVKTREGGEWMGSCYVSRRFKEASFAGNRNNLGPRHHDADDATVPMQQLAEIQTQEGMQRRVGAIAQILPSQPGHLVVVFLLTVRMDAVPTAMPAQVAVEVRVDVVQLVKQGDELVVEILVEESRQ